MSDDKVNSTSNKVQEVCKKNVDYLFESLLSDQLIHAKSGLYNKAHHSIFNTSLQTLFPIIELCMLDPEAEAEYIYNNVILVAYTFFYDHAVDSSSLSSTEVRSLHISSYLLLFYYNWFATDNLHKKLFFKYHKEYSKYIILEKKWDHPLIYTKCYGSAENIYKKALILFLFFKINNADGRDIITIMDLIKYYYSFILLVDDIIDFDEDLKNHCLTYPIAFIYNKKGSLPQNKIDLEPFLPDLAAILTDFKKKIDNFEGALNRQSSTANKRMKILESDFFAETGFEL